MSKKFIFLFLLFYFISNFTADTSFKENKGKSNNTHIFYAKEEILYKEMDNYEVVVCNLKAKNYSTEEINSILSKLSETNINNLLTLDYYDLAPYIDIINFNVLSIDRYNTYKSLHMDLTYQDVVTRVNLNLDKEFYSEYEKIENAEDITVLVNKFHKLDENFEPKDLTPLSYSSAYKLRKEAAFAFDNLQAYATLKGVNFYPYSAFRSYETQEIIYNKYIEKDGEFANTYSAKPGYSEHQTGLAVDVKSMGYSKILDEHYHWLKENAYKYGFIIRYTKDNENITGYQEEPWHLRYIGINHATKVHELDITYDEYYDLYLKQY